MKEHPILFNGQMVNAILNNRKTQTRRVIKPQPKKCCQSVKTLEHGFHFNHQGIYDFRKYPYAIGDRLWVRETFRQGKPMINGPDYNGSLAYKADYDKYFPTKWTPSIHMPRYASRITLEITDVRVERIQEISEEDALSEGIIEHEGIVGCSGAGGSHHEIMGIRYDFNPYGDFEYEDGIEPFETLWNQIYEKRGYGWSVNPWVFVISFKKL